MPHARLILALQGIIALLIIGIAIYIFANFSSLSQTTAFILFGICVAALFGDMAILYIAFKRNFFKK